MKSIIFGGGCFWCTEAIYKYLNGVEDVVPGYIGGNKENPTYEEVCSGTTGHAEVVKITFDNNKISLDKLLEIFFKTHDPTTLNRQGNDVGEAIQASYDCQAAIGTPIKFTKSFPKKRTIFTISSN